MPTLPYNRRLVACAACAVLGLGVNTAVAAPPVHAQAAAKKKLTRKQRAKIRRELTRDLRRNPTAAFKRTFMKKASLVDFKLPLTVRLDTLDGNGGYLPSDDQLEVAWDDSVATWPLANGAMPPPQTTNLSGRFTLEASFGDDATGYGELGALETTNGGAVTMKADPFTISDFNPLCGSGPLVAADPAQKIVISSAGVRYGLMNLFSREFRGSLSLRMTLASQVQDSCGGVFSVTPTIDNSAAPAMPVRFNGTFSVSPALTADGKMRFGKIVIDDSVTPQDSTFAYVRACTGTVACDAQQFPARLKIKKLTADVLLGDVRSTGP